VALAALLGGLAALGAGDLAPVAFALATVGAAVLAAGLWREQWWVVPWTLLALGAAAALALADASDRSRAPLFAAGLLAVGELAYWSLETRLAKPAVPGIAARRLALLSGLVAGSIAVGAVLVSVARIDPGGGLLLESAGVAAAVALAAALLALSRRAA
jgi:hypothetical protein